MRVEADVRPLPDRDQGFSIHYRTEAQLRSNLAELATFYGWWVEEEVVIPGWGRIDLVLREDPATRPYLVELKLELSKPSEIRRAFQQADGYGRWWSKERGEANTPMVVAKAPNRPAVDLVADAYPAVPFWTIDSFMAGLCHWFPTRARFDRSLKYVEMLRAQLANFERAHAHLSQIGRQADQTAAAAEHAIRSARAVAAKAAQVNG